MIIAQLNAIGDTHTAILPFAEQVQGIASVGIFFGGLSLTRTVTAEYRHSYNNTTWSAWLTFDTATLSALTLDPDQPLYQQVRVTRTGTDATGVISWEGFNIQHSIDPTAVYGRGAFTDTGLYGEVGDFLQALIKSRVVQAAGADRYDVIKGQPQAGSRSQLALVSVASLSTGESSGYGIHGSRNVIQANIQIGASQTTQLDRYEGVTEFEKMAGTISAMFSRRSAEHYTYSFNWKDTDFVAVRLGDFGLSNFQVVRTESFQDAKTQQPYVQISVRFELSYSKFALNNI